MASRKYQLYVGYVKELDEKTDNKLAGVGTTDKTIDMQSLPMGKNFILVEDLQIKVSVSFSKEGSSSKNPQQVFEITNPLAQTISTIRDKCNVVLLTAGYDDEGDLPIICATQIVKSRLEKRGTDVVLKLICSEAYKVKRNVRISKSYSGLLSYKSVILDLLNEFTKYGVTYKAQLDGLESKYLGKARVFNDMLTEALDDLCSSVNYKWYMSSSVIYVEPKNKTIEKSEFIRVLSIQEDNLKSAIEEIQDTTNKNASESKDEGKGVRLKLNLNGNLNDNDAIRITFGEYAGAYLITSVKHDLDYEGQAWDTTIECRR